MPLVARPKQGEIWMVEFDPVRGEEIGKLRPAVVLSNEMAGKLALRFVAPVTDWKERYESYPWFAEIEPTRRNGHSKKSGADAFQCKSVSLERFARRIGIIEEDLFDDIVNRLNFCLRRI